MRKNLEDAKKLDDQEQSRSPDRKLSREQLNQEGGGRHQDEPQEDQESEDTEQAYYKEETTYNTPTKVEQLNQEGGGCLDISPLICGKGSSQIIQSWVKEGNFVKMCRSNISQKCVDADPHPKNADPEPEPDPTL